VEYLRPPADVTPVEAVEEFATRVREHVEADLTVFPGAPHSFFDRSYAEHQDACTESWRVMVDSVSRHST
jgi:carboxymethylenebutenolidase